MPHLWLATRNAHKRREFLEMLGGDFEVEDLRGHPEIAEVIEDGATFAENARLKSRAVSRVLSGLVLADDSGLEVESLGGAPGIYSARYAGPGATDAQNRQKLRAELATVIDPEKRRARFVCVLSLASDGEELASFEGTVSGRILSEERGEQGFGYDSLFEPAGYTQTFAELSAAEKNAISHRARAVQKLRSYLTQQTAR